MKKDLQKISAENGNLVYSMWEGYKEQSTTKAFLDWLITKNFLIYDIHTSGHADIETLKELADVLNPYAIILIHTFNKRYYKNVFSQKIMELKDNETIKV